MVKCSTKDKTCWYPYARHIVCYTDICTKNRTVVPKQISDVIIIIIYFHVLHQQLKGQLQTQHKHKECELRIHLRCNLYYNNKYYHHY
jgi:hypothetical protein